MNNWASSMNLTFSPEEKVQTAEGTECPLGEIPLPIVLLGFRRGRAFSEPELWQPAGSLSSVLGNHKTFSYGCSVINSVLQGAYCYSLSKHLLHFKQRGTRRCLSWNYICPRLSGVINKGASCTFPSCGWSFIQVPAKMHTQSRMVKGWTSIHFQRSTPVHNFHSSFPKPSELLHRSAAPSTGQARGVVQRQLAIFHWKAMLGVWPALLFWKRCPSVFRAYGGLSCVQDLWLQCGWVVLTGQRNSEASTWGRASICALDQWRDQLLIKRYWFPSTFAAERVWAHVTMCWKVNPQHRCPWFYPKMETLDQWWWTDGTRASASSLYHRKLWRGEWTKHDKNLYFAVWNEANH